MESEDPLHRQVGTGFPVVSSDHRMAWTEVESGQGRRW
jgi:hypothetical protein